MLQQMITQQQVKETVHNSSFQKLFTIDISDIWYRKNLCWTEAQLILLSPVVNCKQLLLSTDNTKRYVYLDYF